MAGESEATRVGEILELTIGPVAHGGHWVARTDEGQVVFVRHALTGERVRARVVEGGRFLRADAVEILQPAPARVDAPCPLAHADGCGGCDFQHVDLAAQRELKAQVVAEQLQRLAGLDWPVVCEAVPGDVEGLRWRTRMQYVDLGAGRLGLRKHRSHDVVEVADCLIARPDARVDVTAERARQGTRQGRVHTAPMRTDEVIVEHVRDRDFQAAADGFWQVHPGAPEALVDVVLDQLDPRPGETAWDLYGGVGLFAAFLAERVGESGSVMTVEGDRQASAYAGENLADLAGATAVRDRVDRWLARQSRADERVDLVVLDPPRTGAKRAVVEAIAAAGPRAVSYVACDPAALARDIACFADAGYELRALRCLDLFPMTHHVECVALLTKTGSDLR